jgi:hypothetical protein
VRHQDYTHLSAQPVTFIERKHARLLRQLGKELHLPLVRLCRNFVANHQADYQPDELPPPLESIGISNVAVRVYGSATVLYHATSDPSSHGLKSEYIRCPLAGNASARRDCVLVDVDPAEALRGIQVARVMLIFSFEYGHEPFNCALVHWFNDVGDRPNPDTGMRMVAPSWDDNDEPDLDVIPLDAIIRTAHLLPVFGPEDVPRSIRYTDTLDTFRAFYINSFIDHHMFDLIHSVRSA